MDFLCGGLKTPPLLSYNKLNKPNTVVGSIFAINKVWCSLQLINFQGSKILHRVYAGMTLKIYIFVYSLLPIDFRFELVHPYYIEFSKYNTVTDKFIYNFIKLKQF